MLRAPSAIAEAAGTRARVVNHCPRGYTHLYSGYIHTFFPAFPGMPGVPSAIADAMGNARTHSEPLRA